MLLPGRPGTNWGVKVRYSLRVVGNVRPQLMYYRHVIL